MSVQQGKKGEEGGNNLSTALKEAESIIEAAEQRAAALREEAEKSYHEAREKGFQEGHAQGLRNATEQAVRLIEEVGRVQDALSREAALLAIAIADSVIGEQIATDPKVVQKMALKALQESVIGDTVTLVVNPEDESTLKGAMNQFRRVAGGASITIETDDALSRGGCIIRTDFGEVDASIETLLASVAQRLGLDENGE